METREPRRRYATLDALRGVAALAVMLFHAGPKSPLYLAHGYMAVDLFFALSGFVLASAYQARLRNGLALGGFARARLVRIWPLYALGTVVGLALWPGHWTALLLVPDLTRADGLLFPANVAMWSLVYEVVVNLAWAAGGWRLGRLAMLVLAAAAAVVVWGTIAHHGIDLGAFRATALYGLARTVFAFGLGVAMQHWQTARGLAPQQRRLALLLPLALLAMLAWAPAQRAAWDLACYFVLFPAVLWLGSRWDLPRGWFSTMLIVLGTASYPLYCLHQPLVALLRNQPGLQLALMAALVPFAWWLEQRIDAPLRRWLTAALRTKTASA